VKFETSPKMSTYLVALVVGDFECQSGSAEGIPIRVCATPDKKGQTGLALEAAEEILRYYNKYYSVTYPFKKLDVVAVPDFAAGAMENTAAIFYRETLLLADPKTASTALRKEIAGVLAHEMAHQWFGDLVTMRWWDDIWLNEGFATWMETKPVKAWKPEWHTELYEVQENQEAMRIDSLKTTRPIRAEAWTPAEIGDQWTGNAATAIKAEMAGLGRTMTGFANVEEDFGDAAVGRRIMPFRIEDEARARGANFVQGGLFKAFAVRDMNLITGQQQYSGRKVAELVIAALGD